MTGRRGSEFTAWLGAVETDDLPALHTFAAGIRRDLDAVTNGLTLEHGSGAVEGGVGRLKMLKRRTFGRAADQTLTRWVDPGHGVAFGESK